MQKLEWWIISACHSCLPAVNVEGESECGRTIFCHSERSPKGEVEESLLFPLGRIRNTRKEEISPLRFSACGVETPVEMTLLLNFIILNYYG